MGHNVGEIVGEHLWTRCHKCGDSPDRNSAHRAINIPKGVWRCVRCNASGQLTVKEKAELQMKYGVETNTHDPIIELLPEIIPGPGSSRPSKLDRYHTTYRHRRWDAFRMYDLKNRDGIGWLLRRPEGQALILGKMGYLWPDAPAFPVREYYRIVEGPYDVIADQDIAVCGFITASSLKPFAYLPVLLCPDGDVWQDPFLFKTFAETVRRITTVYEQAPHLVGIEVLKNGLDRDEATSADYEFIPGQHVREFLVEARRVLNDNAANL